MLFQQRLLYQLAFTSTLTQQMSESLMIDSTVSPRALCSFPENQARQATLLLVWTRMALEATMKLASMH
jgi:hypothetical protein